MLILPLSHLEGFLFSNFDLFLRPGHFIGDWGTQIHQQLGWPGRALRGSQTTWALWKSWRQPQGLPILNDLVSSLAPQDSCFGTLKDADVGNKMAVL